VPDASSIVCTSFRSVWRALETAELEELLDESSFESDSRLVWLAAPLAALVVVLAMLAALLAALAAVLVTLRALAAVVEERSAWCAADRRCARA
jgi:hypothetical protein